MDTRESTQSASAPRERHSTLRTIVAAGIAAVIGASVSIIGRNQGWPHAQSIGLATFVFLIPVLPTLLRTRGSRGLPQAIIVGLVFALIGGFIHAFALDR